MKQEISSKKFKEDCCVLVLHNVDAFLIHIDKPMIVLASMLGDFGFKMNVDRDLGIVVGEPTYTFLKRGKMIDYRNMKPQNTTISAIVVLENLRVGVRRALVEIAKKEKELARQLDWEETWSFLHKLPSMEVDIDECVPRVVVYENPYARIPLTRDIFRGPFDERYGPEEDRIIRIFAGTEIEKLEDQ